jgi:glutathione S-transferase
MVTLWGRNNSTNVKKVRWTLAELAVPYEQIMAGQGFGVNHDAAYLALNPNGLVPMLKDGDDVLWESNSIVRYLAAQYGAETLWQAVPIQRAKSEKWMDWANETLSPVHRKILIGLVRTPVKNVIWQKLKRPWLPANRCSKFWIIRWRRKPGFPATVSASVISPWHRLSITC